jgi:endonuclease/exonuclease/phosphatase family metal-dependent hydrolase
VHPRIDWESRHLVALQCCFRGNGCYHRIDARKLAKPKLQKGFMRTTIVETRLFVVVLIALVALLRLPAQQPIDLFSDDAALNSDYFRLGSWNLRHINLEEGAKTFLTGTTDEEDFAILTATFAKAIKDLGLDLVVIVEHQPRVGEPNRLQQLRDRLNGNNAGTWQSDETAIPYDNPNDQFGNLQFGLLWKSAKVTINPNSDTLLSDLRQPRNASGNLTERTMRIPWLIPIKVGNLEFDLMVLHLKSGGGPPQAEEVDAIQRFITQRQSTASPRHLIVCGDWNIRPDDSTGRDRLRKMAMPTTNGKLMKVLTVEELHPTLDEWEALGAIPVGSPIANLVPFSHFNASALDTLLDHIAISRTFDEIFDHPIQVTLSDGTTDLRPGIRIAKPLIPEENYLKLTDHLPVVLTLRTTSGTPSAPSAGGNLRIVGAVPNPVGPDEQDEEVRLKNTGTQPVPLAGWKIGDSDSTFWILNAADGTVQPGATISVKRLGRMMSLNNSGDTIVLVHPTFGPIDQRIYGPVTSGQVLTFP